MPEISQIGDSSNLEGQVPVFVSPRNRVTQLYSEELGSLLSPPTSGVPLYAVGADPIVNTASNSFFFVCETCLAIALVLLRLYTPVAW
jgi:hypothetical protein